MDLEAIHARNARFDKFTRVGMAVCFIVTSGVMLATLTLATPDHTPSGLEASASR